MSVFYSLKSFWVFSAKAVLCLLILLTLDFRFALAQTDTTIEDLEALLDTVAPAKSQLVVSAAIGNNPYEQLSKAGYTLINKTYFMPQLSYNDKSGLGLTLSAYDLFGSGDDGWFEYDINPSYTFDKGKDLSFGVSYEKYLYSNTTALPISPLNNEFYTYVLINPWWIQPGLGLDYAYGNYIQKKQTLPASDFDVLLSIEHKFVFNGLFNPEDNLSVIPAVNLVIGTDKFIRSFGSTRLIGRAKHVEKAAKNILGLSTAAAINTYMVSESEFLPRTLETSIDLSYTLGKFTIEPQYYLDFPLEASDQSSFSYYLITVSVGF